MTAPGGGSWAEIGRFVVSDSGGAGPGFLFRHLFPPHGRRERWLRAVAVRSDAVARRAVSAAGPAARAAAGELERSLAALGLAPWSEWVLARPYGADRRGRLTVLLFAPGGAVPDRVVKLRAPEGEGPALAAEAAALERLGRELPGPLARTLPAVVRHEPAPPSGGAEALVLTALPGRSGYVELEGSLAPSRLVDRHFQAAADWLARFHRATLRRDEPWSPPPWEDLTPRPGEPRPEWYRRLEAELDGFPPPRAAGHGDFWVRNLLLDPGAPGGELSGVVDWEHHRPAAPPFEDLFHFAWSYAQAYPWRGLRRQPEEAFERAFLRDTVVSQGVRRYLRTYARETGMDAGVLGGLFRVFLLTRAGGDPHPPRPRRSSAASSMEAQRSADEGRREPWIRLYRRLETADRSAFSG